MKAIVVKVLPATNTKPVRLKAIAEGVKSFTLSYCDEASCDEASYEEAAEKAAKLLCQKYDWKGKLASGGLPNGDFVFCFVK